jgi:predicted chitinase
MGLKDRLGAAKRWMWSPMTIWMADQGCDKLAHAGGEANVYINVRGEDDGTMERIEVYLRMMGWASDGKTRWPLAELPAATSRRAAA